jgi:hypothetical protein
MAAIQQRGEAYRVIFRYQGQQHAVTIGNITPTEASQWKSRTEQLLQALDQGTRELPLGCSITEFIHRDGKAPSPNSKAARTTVSELRGQYLAVMGNGAVEANSLYTIRLHLDRIQETLGKNFCFPAYPSPSSRNTSSAGEPT